MRGFSKSLLIGKGGFRCVFRGAVRVSDVVDGRRLKMDVAVKQLSRNEMIRVTEREQPPHAGVNFQRSGRGTITFVLMQ
ncbi:unnamed protein product [Rhodiola kirilowii]